MAAIVEDSVFSFGVLKYVVCLCKGCHECSVCIVRRGAVARVWEVGVFRHADVVCLCLVLILWHFSLMRSACLAVC